tara:strand:+ start:137 stop:868 length:732 start_codon:yes stop_codon:yes gene_type:complete
MKPIARRARTIAILLILAALLAGCDRREEPALDFLEQTEGGAYDGVPVGQDRIEELRADIEALQESVQEQTRRLGRIASYQKLLARELMNAEMYGPALDALQAAMELQTENPVLYYLAGVSAARSARAEIIAGGETDRFALAEQMYREALNLRPEYHEALYGLAVLLNFELDRPDEALTYARRLSEIETGDPSVRFLLANILVRLGQTGEAEEIYADLARNAPSADQRQRAADNRDALVERQP